MWVEIKNKYNASSFSNILSFRIRYSTVQERNNFYSKETEQGQEWDKNGTGTKHFGRNK